MEDGLRTGIWLPAEFRGLAVGWDHIRLSQATRATLQDMDVGTYEIEEVLRDLSIGLRNLYGERYRNLVLYGSWARGDADEGSDVDLLLLLEGSVEVGKEILHSSGVVASLSLEANTVLSVIPVSIEDYECSLEPYLVNARREGVVLSSPVR